MANSTVLFSDINPEFRNKSAKPELLFGEDSVNNSIRNILMISQNERFMFSEFGSKIQDYIFQPMGPGIELRLLNHIIKIINRWDPRVIIDESRSSITGYPNKNSWEIMLVYSIANTSLIGIYQDIIKSREL